MESLAAGLAIGIAAFGGAIGIAIMMMQAFSSIARQPEASGKIRPLIFVGIAFIESVVLYALVVALILLSGRGSADEAAHTAGTATPTEITLPE